MLLYLEKDKEKKCLTTFPMFKTLAKFVTQK